VVDVAAEPVCPHCGVPFAGPVADELRALNGRLAAGDPQAALLRARRDSLLLAARPVRWKWGGPGWGRGWDAVREPNERRLPDAPYPSVGPVPPAPVPARETHAFAVRTVLLVLGAVLLALSAAAFMALSWDRMGLGGRTAVLGGVTAVTLAVPARLLRNRLAVTAEVVGALGLVLLLLDGYAVHRVWFPGTDAAGFAAAALAVVAALAAGYGAALPGLRVPPYAALAFGQVPLALAGAAHGGPLEVAAGLLLTGAADLGLRCGAAGRLRREAVLTAAALTGGVGMLLAAEMSVVAGTLPAAARAAAVLLAAALLAAVAARLLGNPAAGPLGGAAALAPLVAAVNVLRPAMPGWWPAAGAAGCAAVVLGGAGLVALRSAAGSARRSFALGALVTATAGEVLVAWSVLLTPVLSAVAPLRQLAYGWGGRAIVWPPAGAQPGPASVVLAVCVALLVAASLTRGVPGAVTELTRPVVAPGLALLAVSAPFSAAVAPWAWLALVVALLLAGGRWSPRAAVLTGAVLTVPAASWALRDRWEAVATLALLAAVCAVRSRYGVWRPAFLLAAPVWATLSGLTLVLALNGPVYATGFPLLVAGGAAVLVGAARDETAPLEGLGYGLGLVGLGLTATDARALAVGLGLSAVVSAALALRPARRGPASLASGGLALSAVWTLMIAYRVGTVEAYSLPLAAALLVLGVVRRGSAPDASSWQAYGPALAVGLLPSLFRALPGDGVLRPALLAAAALLVTLAGARHRLLALLVLGGGTLLALGLRTVGPETVRVCAALPGWVPVAAAGAVLLLVGATYEQRLRDAKRVRDVLGRLR
jgi:hypothetical protein